MKREKKLLCCEIEIFLGNKHTHFTMYVFDLWFSKNVKRRKISHPHFAHTHTRKYRKKGEREWEWCWGRFRIFQYTYKKIIYPLIHLSNIFYIIFNLSFCPADDISLSLSIHFVSIWCVGLSIKYYFIFFVKCPQNKMLSTIRCWDSYSVEHEISISTKYNNHQILFSFHSEFFVQKEWNKKLVKYKIELRIPFVS
jgi:hypothetical protein